jgi:hypothetical protein
VLNTFGVFSIQTIPGTENPNINQVFEVLMLAVCVANRLNDLNAAPADLEVLKYSLGTWARFPLTLGKEYLVYGVSFRDSIPWYYVCDDNFIYYPALWSSLLFKLVDGTPSRFWRFNPGICSNDGLIVYPRLVLPNWAISDDYYDRLTDGDEITVAEFRRFKQLMDVEFPLPFEGESHLALEENWLQCSTCLSSWEASIADGMSVCPQCKSNSRNPIYKLHLYSLKRNPGED